VNAEGKLSDEDLKAWVGYFKLLIEIEKSQKVLITQD